MILKTFITIILIQFLKTPCILHTANSQRLPEHHYLDNFNASLYVWGTPRAILASFYFGVKYLPKV